MSLAGSSTNVLVDFSALFCGDLLSEAGISRRVFVLATDPTKVVKVEEYAGRFQNVIEWETWQQLRETKYAAYLAPCHFISPCGIVLIQERVSPLPPEREHEKLPDFLTDFKRQNYGLLDGRVVCCDYGTSVAINHGAFASKLRKPEWW